MKTTIKKYAHLTRTIGWWASILTLFIWYIQPTTPEPSGFWLSCIAIVILYLFGSLYEWVVSKW